MLNKNLNTNLPGRGYFFSKALKILIRIFFFTVILEYTVQVYIKEKENRQSLIQYDTIEVKIKKKKKQFFKQFKGIDILLRCNGIMLLE